MMLKQMDLTKLKLKNLLLKNSHEKTNLENKYLEQKKKPPLNEVAFFIALPGEPLATRH